MVRNMRHNKRHFGGLVLAAGVLVVVVSPVVLPAISECSCRDLCRVRVHMHPKLEEKVQAGTPTPSLLVVCSLQRTAR